MFRPADNTTFVDDSYVRRLIAIWIPHPELGSSQSCDRALYVDAQSGFFPGFPRGRILRRFVDLNCTTNKAPRPRLGTEDHQYATLLIPDYHGYRWE